MLLYRKADIMRHRSRRAHGSALARAGRRAAQRRVVRSRARRCAAGGNCRAVFEPVCSLSKSVKASLDQAIAEVLRELDRLGVEYRRRKHPAELGIWWATEEQMDSPLAT